MTSDEKYLFEHSINNNENVQSTDTKKPHPNQFISKDKTAELYITEFDNGVN